MATLVDALVVLKALGFYQTVFPFLLISACLYGLLTKFEPFGKSNTINTIVSIVIALIFISFAKATNFVLNLVPLLTAFFLIMLFLMLIFIFMGVKGETITRIVTEDASAYGVIILIFVLLVFVVFSQIFPEQAVLTQLPGVAKSLNISVVPEGATPAQTAAALLSAQTMAIIFSPTILGLILMIIVFAVATFYITRETGGGGKKG